MYEVKKISAEETIAVRHPVLRNGRPIEDCVFVGDDEASTFHLGLFENDKLIGIASFVKDSHEAFHESPQYRLRGMAVLEEHQGQGLGDVLLKAGETELKQRNIPFLWFNARKIAWNFYLRNGYKIYGEPFEMTGIGTHYVMYKSL